MPPGAHEAPAGRCYDRGMNTLPLRIPPGADLRRALEAAQGDSAFVVAGIGSLRELALRFAGSASAQPRTGAFELLTLSGSLGATGAHLHASVADSDCRVVGGHVAYGCIVRTTAEVLLDAAAGMGARA